MDLDEVNKWLASSSAYSAIVCPKLRKLGTWYTSRLTKEEKSLFLKPLGENFLLRRVLLVLTGLLIRVGLGRLRLVKLFEAEGLLLLGGGALALAQLPLHGLHLFPQVAVGLLQRAHLLRESPDPLLLLKQSLLHGGAHQLEETQGFYM